MGAKHTPGEWIVEGTVKPVPSSDGVKHSLWCGSVGLDWRGDLPYRGEICRIQSADHLGPHGISVDEAAANARLIAAAPDLLASLKHLVRWHDQLGKEDIARAKAVIAKVEGRS